MNGDPEDDPSKGYKGEDGPGGTKRRGPRTTIKAKQLEILKLAFDQVRLELLGLHRFLVHPRSEASSVPK